MASSNSSSNSVVTEAVTGFLRGVPLFQFLGASELNALAGSMCLEYFPKDTVVFAAGSKASESLYIIKKGGVKLALQTNGPEVVLDMRGEGEFFGFLSAIGGELARLGATAIEDTLCYSLPATEMQKLIASHPEVSGYLAPATLSQVRPGECLPGRLDWRGVCRYASFCSSLSEGEHLLYSLAVEDVVSRPLTMCARETTVQAAARQMAESRSTSIVVVDERGQAAGIVTDKDLREKIVAQGAPLDTPISSIMSHPVIAIESTERVFQALVQMLSANVHHLVVTQGGLPKGVITNHDLLLLQGKSPLAVLRSVGKQCTLEGLVAAQGHANELIPLLIREGAKASNITRVIAEMNDRVLLKILEFAKAELGPPPVPYCWVTMGSEGRREQTFRTDRDNGLIYEDPLDEWQREAAREYFSRLAEFARAALERCGYPPCEGGYMASNQRWRQPLVAWKNDFEEWITDPNQTMASDALIFFDMRPVAGEFTLYEELRRRIRELLLKEGGVFKSILAFVSISHKPPLGFFHGFVLDRSGEHKHEFDLKWRGTGPIVNAARLFAVDSNIEQTNTIDRLSALQAAGYADPLLLKELQEALEFLMLLRLERQLEQASSGQTISNHINPDSLTNLQKGVLKQAFQSIERAQSLIKSKFQSPLWSYLR